MNSLNFDNFAISFSADCVNSTQLATLQSRNFMEFNGIVRGYIPSYQFASFVNEIGTPNVFSNCLLDLEFELIHILDDCMNEYTQIEKYPVAWHLDALDGKIDNQYLFYNNITNNSNVDLWILDTGVNWRHNEFYAGQVIDVDPDYTIFNLQHPHGTGTAAMAAGKNYGTSKNHTIYNYPVCRIAGSCGSSDVEKGLKVVLEHVKSRYPKGKRSVINMSFGIGLGINVLNSTIGTYFNGLFDAITANGGIIVVAAGNSNQDACEWLYSFSPFVISVGSIKQNYNKSSFSNYGNCIDIWSYGDSVPTAYSINDNNNIQYKSGTSFSAPLVSGLIINLLHNNPNLTRGEILNILQTNNNNYNIAQYNCGQENFKCCQGLTKGTRLDKYCRTLTIYNCPNTCKIKAC